MLSKFTKTLIASSLLAGTMLTTSAFAQQKVIIGLITKTNTNPFFVKMREGAEAKAKELGAEFRSFAGKVDGDNQTQVEAVESLIAAGAKGILITPSDSKAIVPAIAEKICLDQNEKNKRIVVFAICSGVAPVFIISILDFLIGPW